MVYGTDSADTLAQRGSPISDHTSASPGPDRPNKAPRAASTRRRLYGSPGCQTVKALSTVSTVEPYLPWSTSVLANTWLPGRAISQRTGPGASSRHRSGGERCTWGQPARRGEPGPRRARPSDPGSEPRVLGRPGRRTQRGAALRLRTAARARCQGPSPAQEQPSGPGRAAGPGLRAGAAPAAGLRTAAAGTGPGAGPGRAAAWLPLGLPQRRLRLPPPQLREPPPGPQLAPGDRRAGTSPPAAP
uniref:small nuclear ribonucleoprotein-associated protein B'-like n=1 Tax=Lonchura striata TaxID=40157 RepID=UPI000B4DCAEC|nr:small nuclear ribonucleoprotein-associated protein B'-like [Lonchura striata domestica]